MANAEQAKLQGPQTARPAQTGQGFAEQLSPKASAKIRLSDVCNTNCEQPSTARMPSDQHIPAHPGLLTPAQALRFHRQLLSEYEQGEILEYKQVYFLGSTAKKVKASTRAPNNHGFDDERGDYKVVVGDHLAFRYEVLGQLGKGSFGQVLRCRDHKTGQVLAVKIIRNKKRFHHQALVEVKLLVYIRRHDSAESTNIVHLKESFYFRHHLCITFPLLSINLYEFIRNNNFRGVSLGLIRRFAIQLLTSLRFMHKHKVVHCDLKPENILLRQPNKSGIRVIDFGSSCFENETVYTYIQSRFYRSPEVILGLKYGMPIDMWSFGCILAELFAGLPIFPGEDEAEQLACIMEIFGPPPKHMADQCSRRKVFFLEDGSPKLKANSRGKTRKPKSKVRWSGRSMCSTVWLRWSRAGIRGMGDREDRRIK